MFASFDVEDDIQCDYCISPPQEVLRIVGADWAVFEARRLAQGMESETAVTRPAGAPTVPVAEHIVA